MSEDDTRAAVLAALGEVAPEADLGALDAERSFREQLDFDSVDYLNFVIALERRLGAKLPELDYPRLSSLAGAVRYLETRCAGAP